MAASKDGLVAFPQVAKGCGTGIHFFINIEGAMQYGPGGEIRLRCIRDAEAEGNATSIGDTARMLGF